MFLFVNPLDSERRIQLPFPINCDFLYLLECVDEMICRLISNILDFKVINNEVEGDGYSFVGPYS